MPIAEEFHRLGADVTSIVGFRSKDIVILEDEFKAYSDRTILMTDDGSYGRHGNVTVPLKELLEAGERFDMIITIGPLIMMKFVVATAKPFWRAGHGLNEPDHDRRHGHVRRLPPDAESGRQARDEVCLRGRPDFDGYEVDFDEAMSRGRMYNAFERKAYEETCNLLKQG